jgi:hypothetical protein
LTLADMVAMAEGLRDGLSYPADQVQHIVKTLQYIEKPHIQAAIRLAHEAEKAKADPAVKNLMDTFPGQVILRHASE